ncbi:adenylosuccinate lyase [Candidatus Uhrbacteria bacterium]|nr:adenylosuccinate lyase [Candidatus Uhrbacteria bacterium]
MANNGARDPFDNISPIDYRYWSKRLSKYLSENAFTRCKLEVEQALVRVLARRGICAATVVEAVAQACARVTTAEVYAEEERIHHDVRALVNCIRAHVSDDAKPYVHMTATSYDIVDTANAVRYRNAMQEVLLPALTVLLRVLVECVHRYANTTQIGRTHGQHAVPITFGFAMAEYVHRLGNSWMALRALTAEIPGKFSGAVGAYNASSLFFEDPEEFEREVLEELELQPSEFSTQVVPPEALTRLFSEITIAAGILANLADDLRHLQRTEIGEVGEAFAADQVGSSTMPQKRNPINFENAKSCWKIVMPRIITVFMDQISEHQRDLTNSASARTYGEVIAYVVTMTERLARTIAKLSVDPERLAHNLALQRGLIVAEPLYIMLAALGHPHAHERVRQLTLRAQREARPLEVIAAEDVELQPYLARMTPRQRAILADPTQYTGIAAAKAVKIADYWKLQLQ